VPKNHGPERATQCARRDNPSSLSDFAQKCGDTLLATGSHTYAFAAMQGVDFNVPAVLSPLSTTSGSYWIGGILGPATDTVKRQQ